MATVDVLVVVFMILVVAHNSCSINAERSTECGNSCFENDEHSSSRGKRDNKPKVLVGTGNIDIEFKEAELDTIIPPYRNVPQNAQDSSILLCKNQTQDPHLLLLGTIGSKVYYRSLGLRLTWAESLNFCHSNGLRMATIESAAEQQALHSSLTPEKLADPSTVPQPRRAFWIGGIWIRGGATDWYWMPDGRKFGYTNWHQGEPNLESEICLELVLENLTWNNCPCTFQSPVICEKNLVSIGNS